MASSLATERWKGFGEFAAEIELSRHQLLVEIAVHHVRLHRFGGRLLLRSADAERLRSELSAPQPAA